MSLKTVLWSLFSFDGRLTRLQFFGCTFLAIIFQVTLMTGIGNIYPASASQTIETVVVAMTLGVAAWMIFALAIKRARDIGMPVVLCCFAIVIAAASPFLRDVILHDASFSDSTAAILSSICYSIPGGLFFGLLAPSSTKQLAEPARWPV